MHKAPVLSPLAVFLTCAALVWVVLIVVSPMAVAQRRTPLLTLIVYEIGGRICHQRPERSFHVAGVQMPVCARCFGLYVAGAAGLAVAWLIGRRHFGGATRLVLAIAAAPIAVSVALEWIGVIHTSNVVRMLTGLPLGLAAGVVVVGALRGSTSSPPDVPQ